MRIIEINQGMYADLSGKPKDAVLDALAAHDAAFLEANPRCLPYHRPSWWEREVPDTKTAPWGYVWYVVDEAGLLRWHSQQYDSSG